MRTHLLTVLALTLAGPAVAATLTVQPGDTLTRLAVRHGTTPEVLIRANPGVNPGTLRVGAVLRLPVVSRRTWTVRQGDTLSKIAQRNGTTLGALLAANPGLKAQEPLRVGQRLALPAAPTARPRAAAAPVIRAASIRVGGTLPVQGRVTTFFGTTHPGLDLAAPAGTPIRAALPGTVTESRYDGRTGWGWTIVVDHGGGRSTRYSHNSVNLVQVGAQVRAGQVIARVGSTGNSTGAHLDYRLYQQGQAVSAFSTP